MTGEELIKAVTWAIHSTDGDSSAKARAAIRAVHEAMREVSEAMRSAGLRRDDYAREHEGMMAASVEDVWAVMLAAHPITEVARDEQ